jgi:Sec-independent protein translocase protein TatA
LSALIIIAVLLLLLIGGDRLAAIGKGLGDGVRGYKKARREPPDSKPQLRPPAVVQSPPKLLPAKGESSPSNPPERSERSERDD